MGLAFRAWRAGSPWPAAVAGARTVSRASSTPAFPKDYLTQNLIGNFHQMLGMTWETRDWPRARRELDEAAAGRARQRRALLQPRADLPPQRPARGGARGVPPLGGDQSPGDREPVEAAGVRPGDRGRGGDRGARSHWSRVCRPIPRSPRSAPEPPARRAALARLLAASGRAVLGARRAAPRRATTRIGDFRVVAAHCLGVASAKRKGALMGRLRAVLLAPALERPRRGAAAAQTPLLGPGDPGQLVHDEQPAPSGGHDRSVRQFRRRLEQRRAGRRQPGCVRPALRPDRRSSGHGVPGQHVHDGESVRRQRRARRRRQLRRRVDQRHAHRRGRGRHLRAALRQPRAIAVGGEFHVNTYTTSSQYGARVAMNPSGNFVVVWTSIGQDGDSYGVFGQRFDAARQPAGERIPGQHLRRPGCRTRLPSRWTTSAPSSSSGRAARRRRRTTTSSASATAPRARPLGGEFQVNAQTGIGASHPGRRDRQRRRLRGGLDAVRRERLGIFARRYDADGDAEGAQFQVNTYTTGNQVRPSIAFDQSHEFIVAWQSKGQDDPAMPSASASTRSASADPTVPVGSEFPVNVFTTRLTAQPAVAMNASGNFAVVWTSEAQDGSGYGIVGAARRVPRRAADGGRRARAGERHAEPERRAGARRDRAGRARLHGHSELRPRRRRLHGERFHRADRRRRTRSTTTTPTTAFSPRAARTTASRRRATVTR